MQSRHQFPLNSIPEYGVVSVREALHPFLFISDYYKLLDSIFATPSLDAKRLPAPRYFSKVRVLYYLTLVD
jgi:hypothetical protein